MLRNETCDWDGIADREHLNIMVIMGAGIEEEFRPIPFQVGSVGYVWSREMDEESS